MVDDEFWMRRALTEAERGMGRVEPNPMVGALIVVGEELVGFGRHRLFGGPHAEVEAIERAGERALGSTLYVTLEPCCHHGKTPPCTEAILKAGIARVVAAMRDPFPKVSGEGERALIEAGVQVEIGVLSDEARRLNAPYLKRLATGRPFVTAKWAMTLDGKTATASGQSRWISNERSRSVVHELRGRMDAIVVGIGTALADDPSLTVRPEGQRTPVRVVLDSAARLPPASHLALTAQETPVWVVVNSRAPADRKAALRSLGCRVLELEGSAGVPIGALLDFMGVDGMTNVLVEGGGSVLGSFLDAGEVDAIEVFIAPILEGGDHPRTPIRGMGVGFMDQALRLEGQTIAQLDGDLHLRARLHKGW